MPSRSCWPSPLRKSALGNLSDVQVDAPGVLVVAERADPDPDAGARCLDDLAVTDVDGDVVGAVVPAGVVPGDEVAGLKRAQGNLLPGARLLGADPRKVDPELLVDLLDQPGAVQGGP